MDWVKEELQFMKFLEINLRWPWKTVEEHVNAIRTEYFPNVQQMDSNEIRDRMAIVSFSYELLTVLSMSQITEIMFSSFFVHALETNTLILAIFHQKFRAGEIILTQYLEIGVLALGLPKTKSRC